MNGEISVTVRAIVTTKDANGDSTTSSASTTHTGVMFEPEQSTERTDSRSPGVVTPAKFYFPTALALNADDEIDAAGVTWRVKGGSSVWVDQTEVAVERTAAV